MAIEFARSERSTLGIEWELALVDPRTRELACDAPAILARLQERYPEGALAPHATAELLENTVEIVSAPHATVAGAIDDLRALSTELVGLADERGLAVMGAGAHPFSRWEQQRITRGERYARFIERTRWWGRNMLIWGIHVHLGVDRRERVIPLLHALLSVSPQLQALAASSPFWRGESTGYLSNRTLMFQQLSTAGLPPDIDDWAEFERVIAGLVRTGVVAEPTEARWDIRPAPRWGTIEMRACDGTATLWEAAGLAALSQCLVEQFQERLDRGEELPRLPPWFVRENKWRAARYGLDARVIVDADGREAPLREEIPALLEQLRPIAARLDCEREIAGIARILLEGGSAERQLAVHSSAATDADPLLAVVDSLVHEFREGLED